MKFKNDDLQKLYNQLAQSIADFYGTTIDDKLFVTDILDHFLIKDKDGIVIGIDRLGLGF